MPNSNLPPQPIRFPWGVFPPVWIHADETAVKKHRAYNVAKAGDPDAAYQLVTETRSLDIVEQLTVAFAGKNPILVSAHAVEQSGVNAIPEALADIISKQTGWRADASIVQTNIVAHTGADGFSRLARQAEFGGDVARDQNYVLVDDFIGQGGTLANLRSHIIRGGGIVIGATVLTGKTHSAVLALAESTLEALRTKHEKELENWWHQRFGFAFDCLTESEARYLLNTPSADRVRNQITAAVQAGNRQSRHGIG